MHLTSQRKVRFIFLKPGANSERNIIINQYVERHPTNVLELFLTSFQNALTSSLCHSSALFLFFTPVLTSEIACNATTFTAVLLQDGFCVWVLGVQPLESHCPTNGRKTLSKVCIIQPLTPSPIWKVYGGRVRCFHLGRSNVGQYQEPFNPFHVDTFLHFFHVWLPNLQSW